MESYKEKLKSIAFSEPIYKKIEEIGKRHDLNIDQEGELASAIRNVILEFRPSSEFTNDLKEKLEIKSDRAVKITEDVDKEIFKLIKSMVQQLIEVEQVIAPPPPTPPAPKPSIASIEKAGDFQVVTPPLSHSPIYNDHTLSKEDVLADLENIKNLKPENAESYVEHLIEAPVVVPPPPVEVRKVTPPPTQPAPAPEQKKYSSPDPYREAI